LHALSVNADDRRDRHGDGKHREQMSLHVWHRSEGFA
jgi:hypothetical protein